MPIVGFATVFTPLYPHDVIRLVAEVDVDGARPAYPLNYRPFRTVQDAYDFAIFGVGIGDADP
jgi:hypothetical protein